MYSSQIVLPSDETSRPEISPVKLENALPVLEPRPFAGEPEHGLLGPVEVVDGPARTALSKKGEIAALLRY